MGESVMEGPATMQATTQDEEVGESKHEESVGEEEPEAVAKVAELSTIGKGKRKAAPVRAKVFSDVDGLVSNSTEVDINMQLTHMLTVRPVLHTGDNADVHHHTI
jgi:hypothetical protein